MAELRTWTMEAVAHDPGVLRDGRILTTSVTVPWERLLLHADRLKSRSVFWNDVELDF